MPSQLHAFCDIYFIIAKYLCVAVTNVACPRAADIILALDQSSSIEFDGGPDTWHTHVLGFAKGIVGAFPIGENLTQIGLLKFSDVEEIVFQLNTYSDHQSLLNAINNTDINGGQTNLTAPLRTARQVMFAPQNGARLGIPKILVLLVHGMANVDTQNTLSEANQTKAANITIFTVGITERVDEAELRTIASTPDYVFFVSNFTQLNSLVPTFTEDLCREAAVLPTTTTTSVTTTPSTTATTTITPTTTTTAATATTIERVARGR